MPFTGGDHAPLALRNFVGDGDGGLSITVVVDTREGWMDCDLSKGFIHYLYLTFVERLWSKRVSGGAGRRLASLPGALPGRQVIGVSPKSSFSFFTPRRRRRAGDEKVGAQPQATK